MHKQCPCIGAVCCYASNAKLKSKVKQLSGSCSKANSTSKTCRSQHKGNGKVLHLDLGNEADSEAFRAWYVSNDIPERSYIPIPIKEVGGVTREWFSSIISRVEWLDDEHMNALLNLLVREMMPEGLWLKTWSIMETQCWEALTQKKLGSVGMDILILFLRGRAPSLGCLKWEVASSIYGVGNVLQNHWVLYEISLVQCCILVYDSMSNQIGWDNIAPYFVRMAEHVLSLCRTFRAESERPWDVIRYTDPPQQMNTFDCWIMVLEYFWFLVNGL